MKNALEWIKSNPFNVTAAAIAFVGIAVFAYILFVLAPKSATAKSDELQQVKQTQDMLLGSEVLLPNEDPNALPDPHSVVINQQVITRVRGIYDTIRNQQTEILTQTQAENSSNHTNWLLGGNAIWNANASVQPQAAQLTQAAADYLTHHKVLFQHDAQTRWNMPYLAAGGPPTPQEIETLLSTSASRFLGRIGQSSASQLNQQQAEQLFSEQREKLMELLMGRARDINLYVTLPPEDDRFAPEPIADGQGGTQPTPNIPQGLDTPFGGGGQPGATAIEGYPFPIAPWAQATTDPQIDELWEGQVQLWILRDIMWAIYNTCEIPSYEEVYYHAGNPAPSGSQFPRAPREREGLVRVEYDENSRPRSPSPYCVIFSPIKRLLVLETLQGYVGLHNAGAAIDQRNTNAGTSSQFIFENRGQNSSTNNFGNPDLGGRTQAVQSIYPTPASALVPQAREVEIRDHFGITPTGRVSNSVFDVRHSRLVIDIEWDKLPAFMAELREVNFMTVLRVHVQDVDEYEMLQQGYVYGSGDVVRAELIIESLWFRDWTENYMPEIVKDQLLMNGVEEIATDGFE